MSAENNTIRRELVPENCIPTGVAAIATYIDPEGNHSYSVFIDIDGNFMEQIGFLDSLKHEVLKLAYEEGGDDERIPGED